MAYNVFSGTLNPTQSVSHSASAQLVSSRKDYETTTTTTSI